MSPFGVSLNDTVNETGMLIGNTSENDETATNDRASSEFSVPGSFSKSELRKERLLIDIDGSGKAGAGGEHWTGLSYL